MKATVGVCLLIACFVAETFSQKEDNSTSVAAAAISTTGKPAEEVVPTDYICRACLCKEGKVDCAEQAIEKFFSKADWAGLVAFQPLQVDLSNNPIPAVTVIVELPIETFNLSHCEIKTIDRASFKNLQSMKSLDLSSNRLTTANLSPHAFEGRYSPEEYEPLSAMRVLNLANNKLHSLHQDLFEHLPELTELDLSGNPFTLIDHATLIAISSLPNLKSLNLRGCQLDEIPDKFLHTPRDLERLDLSNNLLTEVPEELEETKNLLYLNLNQNPIEMLDKNSEDFPGFPELLKLEELHMCNMEKLQSIGEGTLGGLQNLKRLHISFNPKLSFIHPKALARPDDIGETFVWPPLNELYIQSNNLTEIDSRTVGRWDLLKTVNVGGNPYLCDCSTQWMVDVLVPIVEHWRTNASQEMVCKYPSEMEGKTMQHLNENRRIMRCVDKYGNRPEKDGAILLGALIGVLLAVPIMLTVVLLWRRGYFAPCGVRGPADFSRAFYKRADTDDFNF